MMPCGLRKRIIWFETKVRSRQFEVLSLTFKILLLKTYDLRLKT